MYSVLFIDKHTLFGYPVSVKRYKGDESYV